jgi:hypothetical protein
VLTPPRKDCGNFVGLNHAAAVLQGLGNAQPCAQAHAVLTAELFQTWLEAAVRAAQVEPGLLLGPMQLVVLQQEGCLLSSCADLQA